MHRELRAGSTQVVRVACAFWGQRAIYVSTRNLLDFLMGSEQRLRSAYVISQKAFGMLDTANSMCLRQLGRISGSFGTKHFL